MSNHHVYLRQTFREKEDIFMLQDIFMYGRRGVVVITTAQLHSTKSEIRLCACSDSARSVSDICYGEDLWQWSRLKIKRLSPVNHAAKQLDKVGCFKY